MKNLYKLEPAVISRIIKENPTTKTLYLKLKKQKDFDFLPGQFMQIGLPGFGEAPMSISSCPLKAKKFFTLSIRSVGRLTQKLNTLKKGELVYVRGPFGNGFPKSGNNLILIAGGCGFFPLKSVYDQYRDDKKKNMQVFWGCRDQKSLSFQRDLKKIKDKHQLNLILEKEKMLGFSDKPGFVTELLQKKELLAEPEVFVCGPDPMYKPVVKVLLAKKIKPKNIYFSLERRMHCGIGICQHCAIGSKYVCRDGPIFDYEFLKQVNYL